MIRGRAKARSHATVDRNRSGERAGGSRMLQIATGGRNARGQVRRARRDVEASTRAGYICPLTATRLGVFRSGQTGQTVNLVAYAYEGSNPSAPIASGRTTHPTSGGLSFRGRGGVFNPAGATPDAARCPMGVATAVSLAGRARHESKNRFESRLLMNTQADTFCGARLEFACEPNFADYNQQMK